MFDKHAGKQCGGARIHVTDRAAFRPFQTGLRVIEAARKAGPLEFRWRTEPYEYDDRPAIDLLTGSPRYREAVESGEGLRAEIARHFEGARQFRTRREAHLLYPDRKPAVVAFVGGHDSGKTSILVELVPRLKAKGLVVGTIKHTTRDVDDDAAGKDSQRHAAAGAAVAALVTPGRTTSRRFGEEEDVRRGPAAGVRGLRPRSRRRVQVAADPEDRGRPDRDPAARGDRARGAHLRRAVPGLGPDAVLRRLGRDRRDRAARRGARPPEPGFGQRVPEVGLSGRPFIVFDLDGTLIDGYAAIGDALAYAMERLGAAAAARRRRARHGRARAGEPARGGRGARPRGRGRAALPRAVPARRRREVAPAARGRRRCCRRSRARGHPQAVASNKPPKFSRMILEAKGVAGRFRAVGRPGCRRRRPSRIPRCCAR